MTLPIKERSSHNVFYFSDLLDECLSVFKYSFEVAELCLFNISCFARCDGTLRIRFCARMTVSESVFLFAEGQLEEVKTHTFLCEFAEERSFPKDCGFSENSD